MLLDKVELVSVDVVVQQYLHVVMNYPRTLIPFGWKDFFFQGNGEKTAPKANNS